VDAARNDGATPLLIASQKGHLEVVRELLSRGANPRAATTNGESALSLATGNGHKAVAKLLRAALNITP
jgi:ankyrin repeat protein